MLSEYRLKEKKILLTIERLVQILIEASSLPQNEKKDLIRAAVLLIEDIHPLLLELIDSQTEHLQPLIKQLILQKLPQYSVLGSFGQLQSDLAEILRLALPPSPRRQDSSTPEELCIQYPPKNTPNEDNQPITPIGEAEHTIPLSPTPVSSTPSLEKKTFNLDTLITHHYREKKLLKNYFFHGLTLDYYLPEIKTALMIRSGSSSTPTIPRPVVLKGISIIELSPKDLEAPWHILRKLARVEKT